MLKRLKIIPLLLCVMMIITMLAGCGNNVGVSSNNTGKTAGDKTGTVVKDPKSKELRIVLPAEGGIDIHQVTSPGNDASCIYTSLLTYSLDRKTIVPNLAESFNLSEDGKVITIKLPEGLTFTNGDPLNAQAVKASFERAMKISKLASSFSAISKIEATDTRTIVITCSTPSNMVLNALTQPTSCGIVDAAAANKVGDQAFISNPVGYGIAYLKEWSKGNYMVLARNDNYKTNNPNIKNKGPINFETIKFRYISDNFTRINELLAGNVDILIDVPLQSLATLRNNKDINIIEGSGHANTYIIINPDRFSDIRVREALSLAVDREQLKTAIQGLVQPVYGLINPAWIGYSKDAEEQFKKDYAFNLDKAKALLAEAGYKDTNGDGIVEKGGKPLEIEFALPNALDNAKILGPVIQTQLKQLGVKVNIKEVDTATQSLIRMARDYDTMIIQLTSSTDSYILKLANPFYDLMKGSSNKEKCAKILEETQSTVDISLRTAKYTEACKLILANSTIMSLYTTNAYVAVRNNIKGIGHYKDGSILFSISDITKE